MRKINYKLGIVLLSVLPATAFAIKYKSLYQEEKIPFYIALGGGWGLQMENDFHLHNTMDGTINEINQPDDNVEDISIGYGAMGYIFPNNPLRLEVAYNYFGTGHYEWNELIREPVVSGQTVSADASIFSHTVMLNGYLDIIYDAQWVPFIMGGVGYGLNVAKFSYDYNDTSKGYSVDKNSDTEFTSNFVWTAGAGLTYNLDKQFSVSAQVAYVGLGNANVDAVPPAENQGNNVDFLKVNDLSAVNFTAYFAWHF